MAPRYRIDERLLKANAEALEQGKPICLNILDTSAMAWRSVEVEVYNEPVEGAEEAAIIDLRHSLPRGVRYIKILRELSDEELEGLETTQYLGSAVPLQE